MSRSRLLTFFAFLTSLAFALALSACGGDSILDRLTDTGSAGNGGDAGLLDGGPASGGDGGDGGTIATSLGLTPPVLTVAAGTSSNVQATATLSGGGSEDVTATATWTSSDATIATATKGVIAGVKPGTATITVAYQGLSKTLTVTVTAATLVSINVTPASPTLAAGTTQQLIATGTFSDKTTQDLSNQVTWASAATNIATVSTAGLVTAVAPGTSAVTATLNGIAGTTLVTVTNATLVSIAVTPSTPTLPKGVTQQFVATGTYTDGTTQDLSAQATWASSDEMIATISNMAGSVGLAMAVGVGQATISATVGTVSGSTVLTVTTATLVSIGVTPATPSVALGLTEQFTATGVYTDGTPQDLTTQVAWTSSDATVADVSNAMGTNGLATTLKTGSVTVAATLGAVSGATTLTVSNATLVSIGVTPATPTISKGVTEQFTATGVYTDQTTLDLTTQVTWASSDATKATISSAMGSEGLAKSLAVGTTTISATLNTVTGSTLLTVSSASLVSIGVTPATPSVALGLSQQFTATGVYTDATTQDLTTQVTWASSDATKATVSNANGSRGVAKTLALGPTTISATYTGMPNITGSTILTVSAATLVSIGVTPATPSVANGVSQQFAATGVYTDSSTKDLTSQVTWSSSDTTKATISNAMGSYGLASTLGVGTTTIAAKSGTITGSTTLTVSAAALVSINVTPATPTVAKGVSQQFVATGTYTDNSTKDLTSQATWASSDATIATVGNSVGTYGLASTLAVGSATISATSGAISGGTKLTVSAAALVSIGVTPANPTVANGLSQQFTATGVYTDQTTKDLTSQVAWTSSDPTKATISNAMGSYGKASTLAVGTTTISAASGAITGSTLFTVSAATLVSIGVTPANPSVASGVSQQFAATGTYTDQTTKNLTSQVTWASSDTTKATISNAMGSYGLASTEAVGTPSISATLGTVSGSTTLNITAATLVSINVTPATPSVSKGLSQQFAATGTYTDQSTKDVTTQVTWSSSDTTKATISNAMGSYGLASTVGVGTTTIAATSGAISGSTVLTITNAALVSIGVTPATPTVSKGVSQQFTATGTYTDATTNDLTSQVTWASSDTTKATISNAMGSYGLASTVGVGPATISATLSGITGSTVLTVSNAALVSIGVTPATPSVAKGLNQQFTATGVYTDMSTNDLTSQVTWASSDTTKATISNAMGSYGLASTVGVGPATISATLSGITGSTVLTVSSAALVSIGVTPANPTVAKGVSQQFAARGVYTDNSTQDLTSQVTWASDATTVATISNAMGSYGLASTVGVGTANISATLSGVTGSTALTVSAAALTSIAVTPANPTVAKGVSEQFVATGTYTDASTVDITSQVTWSSGTTATATISNAMGSYGLASTVGVGTSTITAMSGTISGSTTLTVGAATLVSIAVTPATPSVAKGLKQQFTATGTYTDASTTNLTTQVTWASGTTATATISNAAGSNGLASTVATGTSTISATYSGVSGTTLLTVTAATVTSIAVTPANPTIGINSTQQFVATGTFTDNSMMAITTQATWASSNTAVATISNATGSNGLATATATVGTSTISAVYQGVTGSTLLTTTLCTHGTTTLAYTGAQQTFTMPTGCVTLTVEAKGGSGGVSSADNTGAGLGDDLFATLPVPSGTLIYVYVGGAGGIYSAPGYNGGGQGSVSAQYTYAGAGGGASDLRYPSTALTDRVLVAGGGGGAGWDSYTLAGGFGGGLTAGPGAIYGNGSNGDQGGGGGTQTAGGAGGFFPGYTAGTPGILGQGGAGGGGVGGGGGGGYYGGGGGGWTGGGGGSRYVPSTATSVTETTGSNTGNGSVKLTW